MPIIDYEGKGRHLESENMYWTQIKASMPKEFVHDCLNPIVSKIVLKKPSYETEKSVFPQKMTLTWMIIQLPA